MPPTVTTWLKISEPHICILYTLLTFYNLVFLVFKITHTGDQRHQEKPGYNSNILCRKSALLTTTLATDF